MLIEKKTILKIELVGEEVAIFSEILFKVLAVETALSPNVLKTLSNNEVKLLTDIQQKIN
jgi:hypothetical protein